jgi:sec-independent protein translocase protein TatC
MARLVFGGAGGARNSPARKNATMPVMDHLTELRYRLIVCVCAVLAGGIIAFVLYNPIFNTLIHPYCTSLPSGRSCKLLQISPLDGVAIRLRIATYGGFVLASPIIFYQLWRFVTPALNPKEKKYAYPFVISSVLLFMLGGLVAWLTFPKALDFLQTIGGNKLLISYTPGPYIRLLLLTIVAFGLAFEFPILLVFLQLGGVVTSKKLASWRRMAIVLIFFIAAVITPSQDPYSLFAMAVPMCLLYEVSILIGRALHR